VPAAARISSLSLMNVSASSISNVGRSSSTYRKTAAALILLASSERGVRNCRMIRTVVLPHRFSGETITMNGEISQASNAHACTTQSAKASAACFGKMTYRVKIATKSLRSLSPATTSDHASTFQWGRLASSPLARPRCLATALSSVATVIPIALAAPLRLRSYSNVDSLAS
jgi:hypothetical protein